MRDWDLTPRGREFAECVEKAYAERARQALGGLLVEDQKRLGDAMSRVERILRTARN
jgi:hypothetical protein